MTRISPCQAKVVTSYQGFAMPVRSWRDLELRLIELARLSCLVAEALPRTTVGAHIAGQLIRSGTSAAPNYAEAQAAESRKDFIHRMRVCLKELRETHVWLYLIEGLELANCDELQRGREETNQLIAIFMASIKTARRNALRDAS